MNELNVFGVFIGDVYVLNYYNILVFFQVSKTTEETVFLFELATKKYKNGIMLAKGLKASKKPLVITSNNSWTKTTYEVTPCKDLSLPVNIDYSTPIYSKALEYTDYPLTGTFYIEKITDYIDKYWISTEKLDKIKNMT